MWWINSRAVSLFCTAFLFITTATAQPTVSDTSRFYFGIPIGLTYITNSSWSPYQLNYTVGMSFIHRLRHTKLSFDWGMSVSIRPEKDTVKSQGGGGNLAAGVNTGSELASLYVGIVRRYVDGQVGLSQYAIGITGLYAGFTPFRSVAGRQGRTYLGLYARGGYSFGRK